MASSEQAANMAKVTEIIHQMDELGKTESGTLYLLQIAERAIFALKMNGMATKMNIESLACNVLDLAFDHNPK